MGRRRHGRRGTQSLKKRKRLRSSSSESSSGSDWMECQIREGSFKKFRSRTQDFTVSSRAPERKQRKKYQKTKVPESEIPQQCHGLVCVNAARPKSKYCSDKCGIDLAEKRILTFLPDRLNEWKMTACIAEERNHLEIEKLKHKGEKLRESVSDLEKKRVMLDQFIDTVSTFSYEPGQDAEDVVEEDGSFSCVLCGENKNSKTYTKHLERCYNKMEKNVCFASKLPTRVEGTVIFCDFLDKKTGNFCKRLKVLCPEHTKSSKYRDASVCGAPLSIDPYELDLLKICKNLKSCCNRHYCWENLRRAEIDVQKVNVWMKLQGIVEEENRCNQAMSERCNVLGLLLHSSQIKKETTGNDGVE